jgi:predicted nucleic acid-binding protein
MARVLLDTNICLRFADTTSPSHTLVKAAVHNLIASGHRMRLTPQVLIEFWAVATRPADKNGLGWTTSRTEIEIDALTSRFGMLGDRNAILPIWRSLVSTHEVKGKNAHDARIAAVMSAHGVEHLLSFNGDDFKRVPHVRVLKPEAVIAGMPVI